MKNTMTTNGQERKSIHTNIAEVHASRVSCFPLDDIEFFEWTRTNKYGHLWYCSDISQSPILQRAIKKTIKKVGIMIHKAHCLTLSQMASNVDVINLLDLLLHTERAMCWCHSTFTVLLFFILKKDLPPLWHASLLQGITFFQICKIKFFRLCNRFNTRSVICFQFLSLTISLEKKLPLMKILSVVTRWWDLTHWKKMRSQIYSN